MREQNVARSADSLGDSLLRPFVDLGRCLEVHPLIADVGCADERCPLVNEFIRARTVLPVVPVLYKEDAFPLKLVDGGTAPRV
jgi:hypothetical protein